MNTPSLAPLTAPALAPLFWRPTRLGVQSAWYGHVPFAHWIIGAHRPASIVELGAHNGVSYAAFCEAVLRENLAARAVAIDSWAGDEHAGFYGEDIYADLVRFHDHRYSGFSTLLRATFDEALPFVPDGSIDLLHIDGRHRYDDVSHDFTNWQKKLSPRAVVLFHDTNMRERDFGVWQLWAELATQYPHFEFLHGHGLGVLAYGAEIQGPIAELCALQDSAAINALRERFALLGERWIAARDLADQQATLDYTQTELQKTRDWAENAQTEVNKLFPQLQQTQNTHRIARANLAQARHDLAARDLQLATLTPQIAQIPHLENQVATLRSQLAAAQAEAAKWHSDFETLRASTSWRLTAPLRTMLDLARGRGLRITAAQTALPPQQIAEPIPALAPPAAWPENGRTRILYISGEDHTPGTIYRVERYVAAARLLGYEARAMRAGPVGPADLAGVSFVIIWREPASVHIEGIIKVAHEQGAIVIFDVDDLMFRPELAVIPVIDGIRSQRFSEVETQAFFSRIGKTLRISDLVTCPTAELAHQAHLTGRPATIMPNTFDRATHNAARRARRDWLTYADDFIRIGYASGSRTHQKDFAEAAPALLRVLQENPHALLTLFKDGSSGEGLILLDEFPEFDSVKSQIEWRNLVKLPDLPAEMARFDINIAPLQANNIFCEAKSELKFFEAALAGSPTIASPSGPFRRAIHNGETGYLASNEAEWYEALTTLVRNKSLRQKMAQSAYHASLAHFGPEEAAEAFAQMIAQIKGGQQGAIAFERTLYRAQLPAAKPPIIPPSDILFESDKGATAEVTIIIPVFKYADYVTEALASVAAQTLTTLDLVVIDDASPDDSATMVLDWVATHQSRFNRIIVARHTQNAGLGHTRNSGFAYAETEFVLPLDADNRLRPQACATLLAHLQPTRAAFAYPIIQQFGDKSAIFGTENFSVLRLQTGNYIDAMALVRKSAWARAGGVDHIQYGWEDFDFWCKIAEQGGYGIQVPELLADYRVHAQSMLHTITDKHGHRAALRQTLMQRHAWLDLPGEA